MLNKGKCYEKMQLFHIAFNYNKKELSQINSPFYYVRHLKICKIKVFYSSSDSILAKNELFPPLVSAMLMAVVRVGEGFWFFPERKKPNATATLAPFLSLVTTFLGIPQLLQIPGYIS